MDDALRGDDALDKDLLEAFQTTLAAPRVVVGCFVHSLANIADVLPPTRIHPDAVTTSEGKP